WLGRLAGLSELPPVLNSVYLGCVMVALAAFFINAYIERHRDAVREWEVPVSRVLFVWGLVWWLGAGLMEMERVVPVRSQWVWALLFFAGSCAAMGVLCKRLDWRPARWAALLMPLLMLLVLLVMAFMSLFGRGVKHPFENYGWIAWLAAFAVHLWVLKMHDAQFPHPGAYAQGEKGDSTASLARGGWIEWWHAAGFWLLAIVASWEVGWQINHVVDGQRVWSLIAWALVPGVLIALFAARGSRMGWPVGVEQRGYLYLGALPVAVYLLLWIVFVNFRSNGDPSPLPYVPIINPLDIAQFGALLALAIWYARLQALALPRVSLPSSTTALTLLGLVLFIALNGVLLRTLHHYADVPFRLDRMLASTVVQASFSLFWSLLALAAMFFANKRALRALWFVGAALLAVVIAKLALVDLSNTGTVARIVSFIGVGIFCVVIGYFAPLPPAAKNKTLPVEAA
ncbi:MAG: DUF2339 domain-containing protein, partial [Betaproteobacteria bacterium]|nr:DUF2339 domain-containing protein [Betaproteobacteria bacterium]